MTQPQLEALRLLREAPRIPAKATGGGKIAGRVANCLARMGLAECKEQTWGDTPIPGTREFHITDAGHVALAREQDEPGSASKFCHMPAPCSDCPFRREGGIRLREARIRDLAENAAGAFPCHKTVNYDRRKPRLERECAGAIIFAYNTDTTTQMLRISERRGLVDVAFTTGDHPEIFASLDEMLETADDNQERAKTHARRRR